MNEATPAPGRGRTRLAEDEIILRDSVYEFADREIRPLVREMDDRASIPRGLIDKLFALGVMGIEIPDDLGGRGAKLLAAATGSSAAARFSSPTRSKPISSLSSPMPTPPPGTAVSRRFLS